MEQVAIVTASGRGIGAACARALAASGYRVALMSRSTGAAELAEELGGIGLQGSVTEDDAPASGVDGVRRACCRQDHAHRPGA